jgi:mannose-6-phosphate isomerase-like protein (cupin superfamily)
MAPAKVTLVQQETAEVIRIGPLTIRVIEDGSNTDNRIGAISLTIPPCTPGPPQHWHRMHDETFLITKGRVRFTTGSVDHDTKVGDYVVVPPKAVHTFSNPFDEEGELYNSFTPAYYVDYLRMLSKRFQEKGMLSEEEQREVMAQFATFPLEEDVKA